MFRRCCFGALAILIVFIFPNAAPASLVHWSGSITDIDGRKGPQYKGPGTKDVQARFRPWTPQDNHGTLDLENYRIHDVRNQKAIDIGVTAAGRSLWWYDQITVRHYEAYRINRNDKKFPGLHMDFLRIAGGGNHQTSPTNVLLDDIDLHDGSGLPIIIQDGWFGTVTLRNIRVYNTTLNDVQFATLNGGHVDRIIVENSPGLHVDIFNRPNTVGLVKFIKSPGACAWYQKGPPTPKPTKAKQVVRKLAPHAAVAPVLETSADAPAIEAIEPAVLNSAEMTDPIPAPESPFAFTPVAASPVPEPSALLLLTALVPLALCRRR